jgi:hypothetical protein
MRRVYADAIKEPPMIETVKGELKSNPIWTTFDRCASQYRQWCAVFGLVPMSARTMPQLPVPSDSKPRAVA